MTIKLSEANRLITSGKSIKDIICSAFPGEDEEVGLLDVMDDPEVRALMKRSNETLGLLGYTEHGHRHSSVVAYRAGMLLKELGFGKRDYVLAGISGYLHDIGNVINREYHELTSAMLSGNILERLGMPPQEYVEVMIACGNHDEDSGEPVSTIGSAVIIADKSDVHRSRVRNPSMVSFDIHDRVNYAVEESELLVDHKEKTIKLCLRVDTSISQIMEYFEIFTVRMSMSRRAARKLDCSFSLVINDTKLA